MRYFELTDLAADTIGKLEAEGVAVFPQDVLSIQALSLVAGGGSLPKGRAREAGGVVFRPLTIGAAAWYGSLLDWMRERGKGVEWEFFAFAFASAHSRDRLESEGAPAFDEVRRWRRTLRMTEEELVDAVEATMAETIRAPSREGETETVNGQDFDRADLAHILVALVGGDLDAWMWTADIGSASRVLAEAIADRMRESGIPRDRAGDTIAGLRKLSEYTAAMRARPRPGTKPEEAPDGEES